MPLPDHVLISRVAAALAGEDAEQSLSEALATLAACGFVAHTPAAGEPWLEVKRSGRTLALAVAAEPARAALRETLADLLSAGLARAVAEDECVRLRERMDMLSAASFEGILIHADGVPIDTNQRLSELFGYQSHQALSERTLERCVAPEETASVLAKIREGYEGAYVITAMRQDGSRFRAELQSKQTKLGTRPVRVVAIRDVTEREHTQALLREGETRLRELAEQAFDFIVVSLNGRVVEVSSGVERVLGFFPSDWAGRNLADFVAASSMSSISGVLSGSRAGTHEMALASKTGHEVPVEVVSVMATLEGEPVRIAGVRDLREKKRLERERHDLEQQLQRSQRLESLGVLAGGIAHDFNNLLVGVLGNAELLHAALPHAEDRELCEGIISAARRAADLTSQLLAYAGQRELRRREPVDLGVLWRELGSVLEPRLSSNARLDLHVDPDSVVLGDRATLTQVLMNLLTNASDALEDRTGTIEVHTTRVREPDSRWVGSLGAAVGPGDWVQIEVRDTGIGMDPPTMLRVFEPFFSTKERGHGLGLASCLGIVSAHGGAISVASEPGKGSRFSVLLPAGDRSARDPSQRPRHATAEPCKVLVIDDEPVVRSLLKRSLERRGFNVSEAADGHAGIRAIREDTPDLVVLDMTMPDLDGAEVVRRVRAEGFDLPILIASGHLDASMEQRLVSGSFQGFLRKPFSVAELLSAIEAALVNSAQSGS